MKVVAKEKQARTDKHRVGNSRAVDKGKKRVPWPREEVGKAAFSYFIAFPQTGAIGLFYRQESQSYI